VFIPTVDIGRVSSQYGDTVFECLDHSFCHTVALRPLWRRALMVYAVIFAHNLKFYTPFPPIISKNKPGDPVPADQVVFQKSGCSFGPVINNGFGLLPLRVVVDGHQDILIA
jgi:hypothetical protein